MRFLIGLLIAVIIVFIVIAVVVNLLVKLLPFLIFGALIIAAGIGLYKLARRYLASRSN